MSHKLLTGDVIEHSPKKKPLNRIVEGLEGKFGVSIFLFSKEFFIGISISDVEIEKIIKRRVVKSKKGKVRVLEWD